MSAARAVFYVVRREPLRELTVDAVLDMLRYDAARPCSNAPDGFWLFEAWPGAPHVGRWLSFGLAEDAILGPFRSTQAAFDAVAHRPSERARQAMGRRPSGDGA